MFYCHIFFYMVLLSANLTPNQTTIYLMKMHNINPVYVGYPPTLTTSTFPCQSEDLVFFSLTMITEHRQKQCCETHRYPCTVLYVSVSRACLSFIQRAVFSSIIEDESKCSPLQTQHPLHNVTLAANPFIPLLCSPILSSVFDLCVTANQGMVLAAYVSR